MRVLIDECLPAGLRESLTGLGFEAQTVRQAGYGAKKNGRASVVGEQNVPPALHQRQKHSVPAEHERPECVRLDSVREIKSHKGLAAPRAGLR